jgi:hypothetical protein
MPRKSDKPRVRSVKINYSPEQEEILDSGLRMLAHMIAETHLKRVKSDPEYHNKLRRRGNSDATK